MAGPYGFGIRTAPSERPVPASILALVGRLYALCEDVEQHRTAQRLSSRELEAAPLTLAALDLVQRQDGFLQEVGEETECLADYLYALVQPAVDPDEWARLTAEPASEVE